MMEGIQKSEGQGMAPPQSFPGMQAPSAPVTMASDVAPTPIATRQKTHVEPIRVADLPAFARAAMADPARYAVLPISPMRAEAQAKNPLARPDDIGLLVGYIGDRCAGYLGLLPGAVEFRGERRPVSSLTGFYIAPDDRASGLATMLPLGAIALGRDLYAGRMSTQACSVLTQLGFRPARPQRVLRLQLSRYRKFKGIPLRLLGRTVDATGSQEKWKLVTEARTPMSATATAAAERPRFVRGEAVVNWMIRNPWIGEDSHQVLRYALPYRREMFRYLVFEANGGGYFVLNVTQEDRFAIVRILDRSPMTDERRAPVLARALLEAQRLVADLIEVPAEYETLLRRSFAGRRLLVVDERATLVHTRDPQGPFGEHPDAMEWSGFEGDAPYF